MTQAVIIMTGNAFIEWIAEAIRANPVTIRRVVIDARVGEPLLIYTEEFGTEAIIQLVPPADLYNAVVINVGNKRL